MNAFAQRSPLDIPELLYLVSNHLCANHSSDPASFRSILPLLTVNHLFHDTILPKLYTSIKLAGYDAWQRFLKNGRPGWSSVLEFDLRITDQILESGLWNQFLNRLAQGRFRRLRVLHILFNCSSAAREKLENVPTDGSEGGVNLEGIHLELTELKLDGTPSESLKRTLLSPIKMTYQHLSVSIFQLQINPPNMSIPIPVPTTSLRPSEDEQRPYGSMNVHHMKPTLWRRLPTSVERLSFLLSTPFPCPNSLTHPSWQGENAASQLKLITNFLTDLKERRALGQHLGLKTVDLSAFAGLSRTWSGMFDVVVEAAEAMEGLEVLV
ncbi:hypothetical protein [Phaffia rhodozyma]|uniref:Uncharacterized protein n=1 Tax=Phaffia rhodozyma TaxID=264483 RepID=A0A0F7SMK4_PHARH|nr:hypothetical protein [Phaffia rhodozyma]